MTNNLHHLKAAIETFFFSLGLGYHHIQSIGLEFLQRCGHQIRVNTWTVSYTKPVKTSKYSLHIWTHFVLPLIQLSFEEKSDNVKNTSRFNKDQSNHIEDFIVFFVTFQLGQDFSFGDNLSITCVSAALC